MEFADNYILINARGVFTSDEHGNKYYRGVMQNSLGMTQRYFLDAQKYWSALSLNGHLIDFQDVIVCTAGNSVIPYNSATDRGPIEGKKHSNRIVWYKAGFNVNGKRLETGWMCAKTFTTEFDAAQNAASCVCFALGKDAVTRMGVWHALKRIK